MSDTPSGTPAFTHPVRVADLPSRKPSRVTLSPDAEVCEAIAADLGIEAVRKLRFDVTLKPMGKRDWQLDGTLGATVVQACVVTLAPVTTRIDEVVSRSYVTDYTPAPDGSEVEMPEDDTVEPLPAVIDLGGVMTEALALALPLYPRADGAEVGQAVFTEPGKAALTDEDVKPFAGLAGLRDQLENKGE
ncbi:DUF177 domain-containing protein [Cognatishimia sp. MH4019]|uniref:YceD family protein n=1 Tax=Cognatishimia sp. MH4019 TaxID=2854030 RepID=UPI001CD40B57|nr:DUF177 domain-containing protein [Cognatishimia sp. MH4019]